MKHEVLLLLQHFPFQVYTMLVILWTRFLQTT